MKKIILIILIILIVSMIFLQSQPEENISSEITEVIETVEAKQLIDAYLTEDKENSIDKTVERIEKLVPKKTLLSKFENFKEIDLKTFKPSYNLFVSNALQQEHKIFGAFNKTKETDNWSLSFINWIIQKTNEMVEDPFINIPKITNYVEFQNYVEAQASYYKGNKTTIPQVGDLILYDENYDGIVDNISILSEYSDYKITDIAGNRWCEEHKHYEVISQTSSFGNDKILGIYRPSYNIVRLGIEESTNLPMNAVDTVAPIQKEEHIKILAENGIEVIARYINPDGRTPLSAEDVKLFSKYGIRTMMIYQINRADPYKGYDKGVEFATKALKYAREIGAPQGAPIFFCCDCPSDFNGFGKVAEFFKGVKDIFNGEYKVGLYGGFYVNEAMYNINMIDAYWQCWGLSDKYISNNYDIIQWSSGDYYFDGIPYLFDANHVKNPEKVSFILEE